MLVMSNSELTSVGRGHASLDISIVLLILHHHDLDKLHSRAGWGPDTWSSTPVQVAIVVLLRGYRV